MKSRKIYDSSGTGNEEVLADSSAISLWSPSCWLLRTMCTTVLDLLQKMWDCRCEEGVGCRGAFFSAYKVASRTQLAGRVDVDFFSVTWRRPRFACRYSAVLDFSFDTCIFFVCTYLVWVLWGSRFYSSNADVLIRYPQLLVNKMRGRNQFSQSLGERHSIVVPF